MRLLSVDWRPGKRRVAIRSAPAPHSCCSHPPMTEPYGPQVKKATQRGSRETIKEVPVLSNSCLSVLSLSISFLWCSSLRQAPKQLLHRSAPPAVQVPWRPAAMGSRVCDAPPKLQLRAAAGAEPAATAAAAVARLRTTQSRAVLRGARAGRRPGLSFAALVAALSCAGRFRYISYCLGPTMVLESVVAEPAEPLAGGLCGEPEQVPAEAGIWGGKREGAAAGC